MGNALKYTFLLLVGTVVIIHSMATFILNVPPNYFNRQGSIVPRIDGYMLPYFSQSWSLFAPNPGRERTSAAFRFSFYDQGQKLRTTQWFDGNALFGIANAMNPLDRLGLEREIYFGQVLIATNDVKAIRKTVNGKKLDVAHALPPTGVASRLFNLARLFMALSNSFVPQHSGKTFVQVALREQRRPSFEERFGTASHPNPKDEDVATLLAPWIVCDKVDSFL